MITDNGGGDKPLEEVFDGLEVRTQSLELGINRYAGAVSRAFASAVTSGQSFDDVLKSLALRMSQMAVGLAMRPLVGDIMGGFNNIFTGGGSVRTPGYMPSPGGAEAGALAPPPSAAGFAPTAGTAAASPHVSIHISTPDAESFRRSEAYVTGQIARAVARGQRTL
jgi:phage-related minor tail protein